MTVQPSPSVPAADTRLRYFREYVTASIAGLVILGEILLVIIALINTNSSDAFSRAKDL